MLLLASGCLPKEPITEVPSKDTHGNDNEVGGKIFPSLILCGLHVPGLLTVSVGDKL